MADSILLTDIVNTQNDIELIYDTDLLVYLRSSGTMGEGDKQLVWHTNDREPPKLIDTINTNGFMTFGVMVKKTAADATANSIAKVQRVLNQAEEASILDAALPVYLKIQLDGATYATYRKAITGELNTTRLTPAEWINKGNYNAILSLTLEPLGIDLDGFTLENWLQTPGFEEDTNSDGLADNWTLVGTPTMAIDTTNYLIYNQSQKFTAVAASGERIYQNISTTSQTEAVLSMWTRVTAGSFRVLLYNVTSARDIVWADIDSTDSGGVSDKTQKDAAGNTWRRVTVSGTFTAGDTLRCYVLSLGGTSVGYFDAAYCQLGTQTAPRGWISYRGYDADVDVKLDTWDIQGDEDAIIEVVNTSFPTTTANRLYAGQYRDGRDAIGHKIAYGEYEWWSAITAQTSSARWGAGTALSGYTFANYATYNDNDTEATPWIRYAFDNNINAYNTWRAAAIVRTEETTNFADIDITMRLNVTTTGPVIGRANFTAGQQWQLVVSNPFNVSDSKRPFKLTPWSDIDIILEFDMSDHTYGADAAVVDGVILLPASFGFVAAESSTHFSTPAIDGITERVRSGEYTDGIDLRGGMWAVAPGKMSRIVMIWALDEVYDSSVKSTLKTYVYPRTRHLLGTV